MRKAFAVAAIAAVLVTARDASAQSFSFGPAAGVSIASFSGDDMEDADSRTGFFGGAQVVWQAPGSLFGVETGALYVQKGASGEEGGFETTFALDYIEIPLLLRIAPPMGNSSMTPAFGLGVTAGFEIGCSVEVEGEGVEAEADCDAGGEEGIDTKSFDLGLTASVGADFAAGNMIVAPFARYTYGLTNIVDAEDADVKNTVILVGAALRFGGR